MANTYSLISSYTVSGTAATISFSSIPQTYTDLCLKISVRSNQTDFPVTDVLVSLNGVTTNQTQRNLRGYYGSATPISQTRTDILLGNMPSATGVSNTFSSSELYIPNYISSSDYKSMNVDGVSLSTVAGTYDWWVNQGANLWSSTNAITSITLTPSSTWSFAANSTAYLYGIKNS